VDVIAGGIPAAVADSEILIHVGLNAEVQQPDGRDGAREHAPLAELGEGVAADEDGGDDHLLDDGDGAPGYHGTEVFQDAGKDCHSGLCALSKGV